MRKQLYKDIKKRILFNNFELKKNILKFIIINTKSDKTKYYHMFNYKQYLRSYIQIKNRCVISSRSRGVYRFFKLSRIKLREYALQGVLYGITKSSW